MKQLKVAIIGHFGGTENITDGQTVKTKILYDELSKATDWKISKVDTYYKKKKPAKLLLDTLRCLLTTKDIIVLLSVNGMKFYFPLLWMFSKLFGTRVYHDVIGGNLDSYIKKYPKFKKYLNSFKINWVETELLKEKVEAYGVKNCEVIPNFKRLNIADTTEVAREWVEPYAFCTFSRVMKEKGIEDAIEAIECINRKVGRKICTLDIYGLVDAGYQKSFQEIMDASSDAIQYKGIVPFDKSVETIKGYYALLFPTFWDGEGFPGTIVDAFSAGLPVIATDWNCNAEILKNEVTGIIYPNAQVDSLYDAIIWMILHVEETELCRINCLKNAEKYQPDRYINIMINLINNNCNNY